MEKTEYVTIKVSKDVYEDIIRAKALMEIQTGKRHSMNSAIKGLLEYAPTIGSLEIKEEEEEPDKA